MRASFSGIGLVLGALALVAAVLHFFAGPIERSRHLEQIVAEKATSLREAARNALKGQPQEQRRGAVEDRWGPDRLVTTGTSGLGALAIVLGVVGFARREDRRMCASAFALGCGALAFHFAIIALGAFIVIALIGTVLSTFGLG